MSIFYKILSGLLLLAISFSGFYLYLTSPARVVYKEKVVVEPTPTPPKPTPTPIPTPTLKEAVAVSLLEISYQAADFDRGVYEDHLVLRLKFENRTSKDIAGIKGDILIKDIFGDLIQRMHLSYDEGISAYEIVTWYGEIVYNQFNECHKKLGTTSRDKLKVEWEPDTYLFTDGTKMSTY